MGSSKLKLNLTEECFGKLNSNVLSRFFIPNVLEADDELVKSCGTDCETVFFFGKDNLENAVIATKNSACAVLLIMDEPDSAVLNKCTTNGILYCTVSEFGKMISSVYAMRVRLAALENSNSTLIRKLDDSRLVGRAKLLLMQNLKMSEPQAHKYIEKTAMDSCVTRRDVAIRIIKTYEN